MSTSVYSSTRLLLMSRNQDIPMFNQPEVRKVKRILFGPVDHKATQKFLDEELKKILVTKSERWNFDFKKESTLNPEGMFEWRPVTPKKCIRPIKRRADLDLDNSDLYCDISDADVVRPKPVKCLSQHASHKIQQQSRITDYMKATKRTASEMSKKPPTTPDWNPDIPTKIPRLDIAS